MPTSDWPVNAVGVGAILRARTRDTNGNELGTFTATTRPSDVQVANLINTAVGDLASAVGADIHASLHQQAGVVATYKAAMLVELSYFPEQVATGRSPYAQLRELYLEALGTLTTAVADAGGDLPGTENDLPDGPVYAFPLLSPLDAVLGPSAGAVYVQPYSGGLYQ